MHIDARWLAGLALVPSLGGGVVGPPTGTRPVGPIIEAVRATRSALPATGGSVLIRVRTSGASSCRLVLERPRLVAVDLAHVACNGSSLVRIGPNHMSVEVPVNLRLVARRSRLTTSRRLTLEVSASLAATTTSPRSPTPPQAAPPTSSGHLSSNWAGYIWPSAAPVRAVAATWTVPGLSCSAGDGALSVWVGVDGAAGAPGGALFQAGSDSVCTGGQQSSDLWWEWYPRAAAQPVGEASAGDVISAEIWYAPSPATGSAGWWWMVEDVTTGKTYEATSPIPYDGPGATADWVVEDPGVFGQADSQPPLVGFTPVAFSAMGASPGPWYETSADTWQLEQSGQLLATATTPQGGSMTVTYAGRRPGGP